MYSNEELNEKVHRLRELKRAAETIGEQISQIEDELKAEMTQRNEYELTGDDWRITWNSVTSNRFSQSKFKSAHPDLFESYLVESTSRRFLLS